MFENHPCRYKENWLIYRPSKLFSILRDRLLWYGGGIETQKGHAKNKSINKPNMRPFRVSRLRAVAMWRGKRRTQQRVLHKVWFGLACLMWSWCDTCCSGWSCPVACPWAAPQVSRPQAAPGPSSAAPTARPPCPDPDSDCYYQAGRSTRSQILIVAYHSHHSVTIRFR